MKGISFLNFCFVRLVNIEDTIDPPPPHTVLQHHLPLWVWIDPYLWEYFHLFVFSFLPRLVCLPDAAPPRPWGRILALGIDFAGWVVFLLRLPVWVHQRSRLDWVCTIDLAHRRYPNLCICQSSLPGFRWLGSSLCIFDLWLPRGCWACWHCAGDGIEVAQVARWSRLNLSEW